MLTRLLTGTGLFPLSGNLYLNDILDILIISLFLYSLLILFKKTRTISIILGLVIVIILYIFAQVFNLYLTLQTLQYFVGVSAFLFVIVFQQEIRKYFELLGLAGSRQIKVGPLLQKSPSTAEIIQSCVRLAQSRIGALIVVAGKDNLDSYISGGIPLDGIISEETIMSIFEPHSYGHDGALIITKNRISQFGVHLPLSINFREIGKHGTRHSAGLGLSEKIDALSIIVSEEKGTISICRDGKMKTIEDFSLLEKELDRFIKSKFMPPSDGFFIRLFKKDLWLKLSAILVTSVIWFFSAYRAEIVYREYQVPVTFDNLPRDVFIETYSPKEITISVSGRGESAFLNLKNSVFSITVDASRLKNGVNEIALTEKNILQPANLKIASVTPSSLLLTARKRFPVLTPVTASTRGQVPPGFQLLSVDISPQSLELWYPENSSPSAQISTEIIDLSRYQETVVIPVGVVIPDQASVLLDNPTVNVGLTIEKI